LKQKELDKLLFLESGLNRTMKGLKPY